MSNILLRTVRGRRRRCAALAAAFAWALPIAAQGSAGPQTAAPPTAQSSKEDPLTPLPPQAVHTISREAHADPAPIPPQKIVESFAARTDEYSRAHQMYGFKRSVRVQEVLADGEKGGEVREDSEVYLADNGRRYERSTHQSSQPFLNAKSDAVDLRTAAQIQLFPLTTAQLKYYDFIYKGTQPLDELRTYIFQVKPKRLLDHARLFSGLVYVDDRDLAVVKLYGRWMSQEDFDEDTAPATPFSMYEIYFENVDGKYWFPTYYRADGYVKTKAGEDQVRLIVKMTDLKVVAPVPLPGREAPAPVPSQKP